MSGAPNGRFADLIVGTAGHIDHGKTSVVRNLTGVDLDTLPEEKRRGITIALGFTSFELPDGRRLAFVDCPGHERLVRTMIAGAQGIDAVLLCVSATDGVMPQTREHLEVLQLLDVRAGVVALTMTDLVDDDLLELAREDVVEFVSGTFLENAPIVACSAEQGEGFDALIAALQTLSSRERNADGPFRLPVDRSFSRPGFGTVATGTSWSGMLRDGASVTLLPGGQSVRVRGLQVHGEEVSEVRPGWRVAINLAGVGCEEVARGTVVTCGDVPCSHIIDVEYRHLNPDLPLEDGDAVRVLLGTSEVVGRAYLAAEMASVEVEDTVFLQLRLDRALPCLPGDRFVVRRVSPVDTLGGGQVVDPWAPRMRRRQRAVHGEQLKRLHAGDSHMWLVRAGDVGLAVEDWGRRAPTGGGVVLGGRVFAAPVIGRFSGALLEALAAYHVDVPLSLGANRRELRRGCLAHLDERVFDGLVDELADTGAVELRGPLVRVAGFEVQLTDEQRGVQARLVESVREAGLGGLDTKTMAKKYPEPQREALIHLLEVEGRLIPIPRIGWVAADTMEALMLRLRNWFGEHPRMSPGEFKELTGLTRKVAIPLLEWLDKSRITRRGTEAREAGVALETWTAR